MKRNEIAAAAMISLMVLVLLALGFIGGRYATLNPFIEQITALEKRHTLGHLLKEKEKPDALNAFYPDTQDIRVLDDYSWSPLCILTPFVGGAPAPGRQNNAQINNMQFRSTREVVMPKPGNIFRVFLTGGSTAYGSGSPSDDRTISSYLEKDLNSKLTKTFEKTFEVFTMASPAWASTHERIAIENLLSELQPDLVISLSGNNDVHWGESGNNILWFRTLFDRNIFNFIKNIYSRSCGIVLQENLLPSPGSIAPTIVAARLLKNVKLSAVTLSSSQTPYLFALQPTLAAVSRPLTEREMTILQRRIDKNPEHRKYFQNCYQAIDQTLTTASGGSLYYLNLSNVFDSRAKEEIFIDSYHFGDRGNEIIGHAIANKAVQILTSQSVPP